jgi:hypothetical protein
MPWLFAGNNILFSLVGIIPTRHRQGYRCKFQGGKFPLNNICISDRCYNYLQQIEKKKMGVNSDETWHDIYELYKDLRVDGFLGNHNPITMSAAIVYMIIKKREICVTQRDLAESVGCSESTIRQNYVKIQKHLGLKITRSNTILTQTKGKYIKEDLSCNVKIPTNQTMKERWCCKNNHHNKLYICKICKFGLYHLQDIPEHYKKKHGDELL